MEVGVIRYRVESKDLFASNVSYFL